MLKTRRSGEGFVAFDGDGEIGFGQGNDRNKSAAFEERAASTVGDSGVFKREEKARFGDLVKIGDGRIVDEEDRVFGVVNERIVAAEADFLAGVVDDEGHEFVLSLAGLVDDERGEKLREEIAAIGRPTEAVHRIRKRGVGEIEFGIELAFFPGDRFFVAVDEDGVFIDGKFRAFEDAAALAVGVLNPDVVVLEIVFFVVNVAADAESDATVGRDGEGGEFFVDGEGGFVELLGGGTKNETGIYTENAENTEGTEKRRKKRKKTREGKRAEKRKTERKKTEMRKERV